MAKARIILCKVRSHCVTDGMECHNLTDGDNGIDCNRVDELCTKQEEADTLMLLHAGHASPIGHDCIVIKSPDTDVDVLTYI